MADSTPSVFSRFSLALSYFWRILADARFAAVMAERPTNAAAAASGGQRPAPPVLLQAEPNAALQLLGLLQQEGRLVDFLEEDIAGYSDAEIGAATRVVHEGCKRALTQHFAIEPVRAEAEGARLTLPEGFDSSAVRVTGNVVGKPPFTGSLTHRGWRVTEIRLPRIAAGHDLSVLAPAEVEL